MHQVLHMPSVLNIPHYSCSNIIIVTNAIILELLSAQLVQLDTPQRIILSFLIRVRTRIMKGN